MSRISGSRGASRGSPKASGSQAQPAKAESAGAKPAAAPDIAAMMLTMRQLREAKQLADSVGALERAKELIEALQEIRG